MRVTVEIGPTVVAATVRPRRKLVVAGAVLAALLLPASVVASHIFSDVPTGMTGHAAIEAIYDAGITGGCGGTKYCPTDPVTRAQMALFMQRGFPRVAYAPSETGFLLQGDQFNSINSLALRTPGGAGKTQFVKADASVNLDVTDVTGCPCQVFATIYFALQTPPIVESITVTDIGWYTIALTSAATLPTNTDTEIGVTAEFAPNVTGPVITGYADLTVISAPFGPLGSDILGESSLTTSGEGPVSRAPAQSQP